MNKKVLFLLLFIAIVTASGLFAFFRNDTTTNQNSSPTTQPTATQSQTKPDQAESQTLVAGTYDDYSEDSFSQAKTERVLFFYASWCYQCRQLDAALKQEAIPAGYSIYKVDYDDRQDLRQKYGVTFRTAFVKVDESGNKIGDEYIAYNEPTLAAVVRDFLRK